MKRLPVRSSSNGGPRMESGGSSTSDELRYKDPMTYWMDVSDTFQENPQKYKLFHRVYLDYQDGQIDTPGVVARVKELLKGYNNLLYGFNIFLPEGYKISVPEYDKLPPKITKEDALGFVKKVKERFQNDAQVYGTFLNSLYSFRMGDKDRKEVCDEITALLDGHLDLLADFNNFLGYKISVPEYDKLPPKRTAEEVGDALGFVKKVKERFQNDAQVYGRFLNSLYSFRMGDKDIKEVCDEITALLDGHLDLLADFNNFIRKKMRKGPDEGKHNNCK